MKQLEFDKIIDILSGFAVSDLGKNACKRIQPEKTLLNAKRQIELTKKAYDCRIKIGCSPIRPFSDISDSLKRAAIGSTLSISEIIKVGDVLQASYTTKKHLTGEDIDADLRAIGMAIHLNEKLQKDINNNFISEDEIADTASDELMIIRKKISRCQSKIREKLSSMISSPTFQKYLQDPIITMRNGKYVLPVKSECRSNVKGILHDQSATGQTVFIEPMAVVEINNELIALSLDERAEIERILYEYSCEIALISDALSSNIDILVMLDVVFAKASMAKMQNATEPILNDEGIIVLNQARHPLIDESVVVPIDIALEKDKNCLLITGPNTGGKTVTLKTIGLFALMAKCGMFICANINSKIDFFNDIYVDIGDEQSIEQSLSTFSGHIKKIVSIVDKAKKGDLCLLDELGAGTDPIEGAALATAIVDTLIKKDVKTIATTHYAELKAFAIQNEKVENASMEFDVDTLSPTYRVILGMAGKSNAFLISEKLGLNKEIIENAKKRIQTKDIEFEKVISQAQSYKQSAIKDKEETDKLKAENEQLNQKIKELYEKQQAEYKRLISKAKDKARKIVDDAREEAKDVVKDIRKLRTQLEAEDERRIQKGSQRLKATREKVSTNFDEDVIIKRVKDIQIGDKVDVMGMGEGIVLSLPDSKGMTRVKVNAMTVNVNKKKLGVLMEQSSKPQKTNTAKEVALKSTVNTEIMLIGKNVEEACLELDKFIDDMVLCGIKEIRIVHGKGTGVLRKGVQSFLKQHKAIKGFRNGKYGEGENGVTIAQIK